MYGNNIINTLLPAAEQRARKGNGSLFDVRERGGEVQFRLHDRLLRNLHAADAPFAVETFDAGVETWAPVDGEMRLQSQRPFTPVSTFRDDLPYLNPHLPFGGAATPNAGCSHVLQEPGKRAPAGSRIRIDYRWR